MYSFPPMFSDQTFHNPTLLIAEINLLKEDNNLVVNE